jgi:hypothetical protein
MDLNLTTYVRRLTDEYNVCLLAYIDISSVFGQHILIIFCSGKNLCWSLSLLYDSGELS